MVGKITLRFLILVIALCSLSLSKAQVAINLFSFPAKQFFIDDLWKTVIINASTSPVTAYIQLTISDNNHASILTVTTSLQNLSPGLNHLTSTEGLSGKWIYGNTTSAAILQQTGRLPYGAYVFCVTVFSNMNKQLGVNCIEPEVAPMTPPQLSSPYNTEAIEIKNPVLTWIPPRPVEQGIIVSYNLRLVEMQSSQNSSEALLQNPPLLNLTDLTNTYLNYPVSAPELKSGSTYAWQVGASYEGYNLGTTDIWTFTVKVKEEPPMDDIIYPFVSKKSDAKFYVSHGIFRFAYDNKANEKELTYKITGTDKKQEKLLSLPQVILKSGVNKVQVDIRKNAALKKNEYYNLEVKDSKGKIYKLLYYYVG
jgi:hypothetical protein